MSYSFTDRQILGSGKIQLWLNLSIRNSGIFQRLDRRRIDHVCAVGKDRAGRMPKEYRNCLCFLVFRELNDDIHLDDSVSSSIIHVALQGLSKPVREWVFT